MNFSKKYGFYADIYDNHFHTKVDKPLDEILAALKMQMEFFSLKKVLLCSLPFQQIADNVREFYLKANLDGVYVAPALFHYCDERDTKKSYLEQIQSFYDMGCDAIKMLEGKMTTRRKTKKSIDDETFDDYYAFAEEKCIPITLHVGDPPRFWDPSQCTEIEISRGWVCTPDEPSLEQLRQETERVLEKFPKLTLNLAHCFFMGNDIQRAGKLLDKYENLYFDIAPGPLVYADFSDRHNEAVAFFNAYADRILYGTDTWTIPFPFEEMDAMQGHSHRLARTFLESSEPFKYVSLKDKTLYPLGLDDKVLEKIYRTNFNKLYGDKPRAINAKPIFDMVEKYGEFIGTDNEKETVGKAIEYFKKVCD